MLSSTQCKRSCKIRVMIVSSTAALRCPTPPAAGQEVPDLRGLGSAKPTAVPSRGSCGVQRRNAVGGSSRRFQRLRRAPKLAAGGSPSHTGMGTRTAQARAPVVVGCCSALALRGPGLNAADGRHTQSAQARYPFMRNPARPRNAGTAPSMGPGDLSRPAACAGCSAPCSPDQATFRGAGRC